MTSSPNHKKSRDNKRFMYKTFIIKKAGMTFRFDRNSYGYFDVHYTVVLFSR